jgi:hypothetical protein
MTVEGPRIAGEKRAPGQNRASGATRTLLGTPRGERGHRRGSIPERVVRVWGDRASPTRSGLNRGRNGRAPLRLLGRVAPPGPARRRACSLAAGGRCSRRPRHPGRRDPRPGRSGRAGRNVQHRTGSARRQSSTPVSSSADIRRPGYPDLPRASRSSRPRVWRRGCGAGWGRMERRGLVSPIGGAPSPWPSPQRGEGTMGLMGRRA